MQRPKRIGRQRDSGTHLQETQQTFTDGIDWGGQIGSTMESAISWLAELHEHELKKGNRNRAPLAVARKLIAYMMAVDKNQKKFIPEELIQWTAFLPEQG